ncbi:1-phosphofructokinase [Corynebacterium hindlerae]|uniref:1-phosphofructokinase n=1 Tax=Corynebacterium hindlerae TaxID=699041 RepID=UPI0031B6E7B2
MILTFTPNPSIDCTMDLSTQLRRGAVHRLNTVTRAAGGKGINVSVAAHLARRPTLAVFPAPHNDPFIRLLLKKDVNYEFVTNDDAVRTNVTITEPDGTTTKLNGPGPQLTESALQQCEQLLVSKAKGASWAVLAGSLPPGAPVDWYSHLAELLHAENPELHLAIDTSDAPLRALLENIDRARPALIKPNGEELGQAVGVDGVALEAQAKSGDVTAVVKAARQLQERGVDNVLVTLGAAGAVLVRADGAWSACPPPTSAVSTVGAGDSSLAGFVMASCTDVSPAEALRHAVAYGSAAASLPGTQLPTPEQLQLSNVTIKDIS